MNGINMYAYMSSIGSLCGFSLGTVIGPVYMKNQDASTRAALDLIYPLLCGYLGFLIGVASTNLLFTDKVKTAHKDGDFKHLIGTGLAYLAYLVTYGEKTQPLIVGAIVLSTFVYSAIEERKARIEESISK